MPNILKMTKEELKHVIKSLNEKRTIARKAAKFNYENQLIELVEKLKGDLDSFDKRT